MCQGPEGRRAWLVSEKDRNKGTVAKEKGNLLEGEGEDDCICVLLRLLWLQYAKSIIALVAVITQAPKSSTKLIDFHAFKIK